MGTNLPKPPSAEELLWIEENLSVEPLFGQVYSKRTGEELYALNSDGYVTVYCGGRRIMRSHLIWWAAKGQWPLQQVDHKNTNRTDDSIGNLQELTNRQNSMKRSLEVVRELPPGVVKHGLVDKYEAYVYTTKKVGLGLFRSLDDAVKAKEVADMLIAQGTFFSNVHEFRELRRRVGS